MPIILIVIITKLLQVGLRRKTRKARHINACNRHDRNTVTESLFI